jgi:hypothetical protein
LFISPDLDGNRGTRKSVLRDGTISREFSNQARLMYIERPPRAGNEGLSGLRPRERMNVVTDTIQSLRSMRKRQVGSALNASMKAQWELEPQTPLGPLSPCSECTGRDGGTATHVHAPRTTNRAALQQSQPFPHCLSVVSFAARCRAKLPSALFIMHVLCAPYPVLVFSARCTSADLSRHSLRTNSSTWGSS